MEETTEKNYTKLINYSTATHRDSYDTISVKFYGPQGTVQPDNGKQSVYIQL